MQDAQANAVLIHNLLIIDAVPSHSNAASSFKTPTTTPISTTPFPYGIYNMIVHHYNCYDIY